MLYNTPVYADEALFDTDDNVLRVATGERGTETMVITDTFYASVRTGKIWLTTP